MSEFKGTPGEWREHGLFWFEHEDLDGVVVADTEGTPVAFFPYRKGEYKQTAVANADLTAAAPDLLAALIQWRTLLKDNEDVRIQSKSLAYDLLVGEAMLASDAAIAKALGEPAS